MGSPTLTVSRKTGRSPYSVFNAGPKYLTGRLLVVKTSRMASRAFTQRISPLWLGIGISGSLLVILCLFETALGRWSGLLTGGEFDPLARDAEGMLRNFRIACRA